MQWFALALSTRLPSHFGMLPAVHKPTFRTPTNRRPLCARWCVLFWTGTAHPENNLKLHTRPSRSQTEKTWNLSELVARPRGHGIKSSKVSKVAPKYTHSQELHILEVVYDMHISSSCWVYVLGRLFAHMCMINSGIPKRERRSFRVGWGSHISRFYAHGWRARTCDCVWNMGDSRDLPPLQEHVISKYGHIQRKKKENPTTNKETSLLAWYAGGGRKNMRNMVSRVRFGDQWKPVRDSTACPLHLVLRWWWSLLVIISSTSFMTIFVHKLPGWAGPCNPGKPNRNDVRSIGASGTKNCNSFCVRQVNKTVPYCSGSPPDQTKLGIGPGLIDVWRMRPFVNRC